MKTIPPSIATLLNTAEGTEPIVLIGIVWDGTNETFYADRGFGSIQGRILDLGELEAVVAENSTSQSMTIVLDDTDGVLKDKYDKVDFQKIDCNVYQSFIGTTDKFLLFKGQISTPVAWNEKDRTISFTIVSEIESYEVGFSPEEGQLPFVTDENIGKPWPLCFGTPIHVVAAKVGKSAEGAITGTLSEDYCVVDIMIDFKLKNLANAWSQQRSLVTMWLLVSRGAKGLAPRPIVILGWLLKNIVRGRNLTIELNRILAEIDRLRDLIKQGRDFDREVAIAIVALNNISAVLEQNQIELERLKGEIELAEFAYNVRKEADNNAIAAHNASNEIYAEYLALLQEKCRQGKCSPETIIIYGGEKFPQGVLTDIFINDVRFRGMFAGEVFTFVAGPLPTYQDLEVDPWERDPDPCEPEDQHNGLATFYLKETQKVANHYMLVRRRGSGEPHVIKVERQEGRKIIFTLVQWEINGSGPPRGLSIDGQINKLFNTPYVPNVIPGGLLGQLNFMFNKGNLAIGEWNQPVPKKLLTIIQQLGGVNPDEFKLIAKLLYLDENAMDGDFVLPQSGPRDVFTIIGEDIEHVIETSPVPLKHWFDLPIVLEEWPDSAEWKADVGTTVGQTAKDCFVYIANILPSTIISVNAYRTLPSGKRVLAAVPSDYYVKNESANLGTIDVTALTFPIGLENLEEGWEDEVYVTLESSIGPNVVDIIQHLIETYTTGTVNAVNFAAVKAKFQNSGELYPANFALYDRPNVLDEISRIAWEARCAIYKVGNEFFLKYLSEEPTSDGTFTLEEVDNVDHYEISYSSTDNLVTRLVANWNPDYLPLEDGKKPYNVTLRHNVKKYGLHTEEIEFHIYNNKELVIKSATFWLIRMANTWKQITFTTFIKNLKFDLFDCLTFLGTKSIIKSMIYNTKDNAINIGIELPVRAGETEVYPYYWPALLPANTLFPTVVEIEKGYAGGFGPGSGVTGTINDCES